RLAPTPEGDERWVRVHLVPDVGPTGDVRGIYSLVIDVDQDHRLREALQAQEARTRFFSENIPGPIAMVSRDLHYVFANKVFASLHGRALDQLIGRAARDVLGEEVFSVVLEPRLAGLRRGES